jgi:integrase
VYDGEISANPAHIRGAGTTTRAVTITPATLDELTALVSAMPERRQAMILLAAWCGLRFGEITELRRRDIDLHGGVVHVYRAVTRVDGEFVITTPKSAAGRRDVAIPPHLSPALDAHLRVHTLPSPEALLFPAAHDSSRHLAPGSLYKTFHRARATAGRPDLRWHDLRHTGAVLAAHTGATLAELMGRLGHSTPQAALRYQHAAQGRDAQIASALSRIAVDHEADRH